jgi:Flp pilus assembly protein TadD
LDREIASDEAARKSGAPVDATLLANLRMTKQARDLIASGDTERAADLLERAIAMDDGEGYAYLYLGYIHLSAGRRDQAEVFLARAAGLLPRDPALRVELARLREEADSGDVPVAGSR